MAPSKSKDVNVTITPSPLPSGHSILLSCEADDGTTGSASVDPETITESTAVSVTGEEQSWGAGDNPAPDNIKLKAKLGENLCAEEAFTVCEHVTSVSAIYVGELDPDIYPDFYGFVTEVVVMGDSGDLSLLDKVYIREIIVREPCTLPFIQPPDWNPGQPIQIPQAGYPCNEPRFDRPNWRKSGIDMDNLVEGGPFNVYQTFQVQCKRCMSADQWEDMKDYVIIRSVELRHETFWYFILNKPGVKYRMYYLFE